MKYVMCLSLIVTLGACNSSDNAGVASSSGGDRAPAATSATNSAPRTQYLASNVVFDSSAASASAASASAFGQVQRSAATASSVSAKGILDTTTKILASDIIFTDDVVPAGKKTVGRLKSKNLKSALQNEIAVNVATSVVGTWDVVNHSPDFDNQPGVVTFTETEVRLESGNMEPFYLRNYPISNTYAWGIPAGIITYKMISNGVMLVNYTRNGSVQYFAPMVVMDSPTTMTLVLYGTDGGVNASKVAVMKKRITAEEKAEQEAEGFVDDGSDE